MVVFVVENKELWMEIKGDKDYCGPISDSKSLISAIQKVWKRAQEEQRKEIREALGITEQDHTIHSRVILS